MKPLFTLLMIFVVTGSLLAQGTIRGFVKDKDTGEPIIAAAVELKGTTTGAFTDYNGFYTLSGVTAGTYDLIVTYIGYDTTMVQVVVKDDKITNQPLYMTTGGGVELATVNVTGEREEAKTEVKISTLTVTTKEIKSLPGTGGEADLAQYLQVLPGVVFTGDQGGQLYIRGGSPVQNKILLNDDL